MFISRTRRMKPTEETDREYQEIGKKPDTTNLENLPEYI